MMIVLAYVAGVASVFLSLYVVNVWLSTASVEDVVQTSGRPAPVAPTDLSSNTMVATNVVRTISPTMVSIPKKKRRGRPKKDAAPTPPSETV